MYITTNEMKKEMSSSAEKKDIEHFQKQLDECCFIFRLNPFYKAQREH